MSDIQQIVKVGGDVTAIGAVVATLTEVLPPIAAAFTIIWLGMQIVINWSKFTDQVKKFTDQVKNLFKKK